MGFLYFFPGQIIADPKRFPQHAATLEKCGLTDVFRDGSISYREADKGPSGGGGCVCCIGDMPDNFGYYPDKQTWVDVGHHWLGWSKKPGPSELLRGKAPEGHLVELGDGNKWMIPCVQAVSSDLITLPQSMQMDDDGNVFAKILPGHESLIAEAQFWWSLFENGGSYEFGRFWKYALSLLSVCYRVGRAEVNALDLILTDRRMRQAVVFASLGVPDIEEQKKTDAPPDTSNS